MPRNPERIPTNVKLNDKELLKLQPLLAKLLIPGGIEEMVANNKTPFIRPSSAYPNHYYMIYLPTDQSPARGYFMLQSSMGINECHYISDTAGAKQQGCEVLVASLKQGKELLRRIKQVA